MSLPTTKDVGQIVKFKLGSEYTQGTLRYLGRVDGAPGEWCGIELREPKGKNNGTVKDKVYFSCSPLHGIFVKRDVVQVPPATRSPAKRLSTLPSTATASKAPTPVSKRTSIVPSARSAAARQSISTVPARKTPVSRPTSQVISQNTVQARSPKRASQLSERSSVSSSEEVTRNGSVRNGERRKEEAEEQDGEDEQDRRDNVVRNTERMKNGSEPRAPGRTNTSESMLTSDLSRENGALKVKLQAMEKKRMEDREAIKKIDTLSSENERLGKIIKTLQVKVRTVTDERGEAQTQVRALEQKLQETSERPVDVEAELELATLDKEEAEERAASMKMELDNLREQYDDLVRESEILREEHNELASTMTDEERANAGLLHLTRERDRLRHALLLLRDNKQEVETQLREEIQHLQGNLDEAEDTAAKYLDTLESLTRAEDVNANLKEQLEAAENQEEVISSMLSERDRHLDQIENLRSNLSALEELAQTNEDLEIFYAESERATLARLDLQEEKVQHRDQAVRAQQEQIEALEFTISKYHKVVQDLQADIEEARRTKEISELRASEMNTKSRAMLDLNMTLQKDVTRSQAQSINIEMAKSEARLKSQHAEILSLFLPESFDTERTPITALLSFSRLKTKATIVANTLSDRLRDRGHLDPAESVLACYEIVEYMRWIRETADRFERFMSSCTPAEYVAFSNAGQELEPVERAVTDWLEQLKTNELGNDGPDHMKRMQGILSDMAEVLIPSNSETEATRLLTETHTIESHVDMATSLFEWLSACVKSRVVQPDEEEEDENPEAWNFTNKTSQLATRARTLRLLCGRAIGELERNRSKKICLDETSWHLFADTTQHATILMERIQEVCQVVVSYFNDISPEDEQSHSSLFGSLNNSESDVLSELAASMDNLYIEIENLTKKSADLTASTTFESRPAPWTVRAKEVKAQRHISSEFAAELQQLQHRNAELTGRIVEKERIIEETTIRAEHFERRVKDNKSKESAEKALKDEIEKLATQKSELDSRLSILNTDLRSMQDQNKLDKDEIASLQLKLSKTNPTATAAGSGPGTRPTSQGGLTSSLLPTESTELNLHLQTLTARIASLESTIRHLRAENKELTVPISEVKYRIAHDAWLNPANLKRGSGSGSNTANKDRRTAQQQQQIVAAENKRQKYHEALVKMVHDPVMSRQIKLAETWKDGDTWRSEREGGKWLIARQRERMEILRGMLGDVRVGGEW